MSKKNHQQDKKTTKVLITGGGSGGHVVPLMAIVDELGNKNIQILYVGSGSQIEKQFANVRKLKYMQIMTGKWRRYFDINNFIDIFKVAVGFIQSLFIVIRYNPDIVFSKGGYVGLPVVYASSLLGKKIYIHETDSVVGLANRKSINMASKIFTGYPPQYYLNIPASKIVYTGNPIRNDFKKVGKKKIFSNNKQTILITGGSQGARFINQTIAKIIPHLTQKYNLIHICGKNDYEWLSKNKHKWADYKLIEFASPLNFAKYLNNCDLVISRAGGTISEIAYCKKTAIIIPLPGSANNHQYNNAKILEKENAAVVLGEERLSSESLIDIIDRIMEDSQLKNDLSQRIAQFFQKDSQKIIVKEMLDVH
jgi:UDP-N-acetylglucosamine--N-acetylmuramyl-(pentapeptide) pyrophosphoryl-undecaprenol N-acetylglucosamine transferase